MSFEQLGRILVVGSIGIVIPYFFLFARTIASLPASEQNRLRGAGALPGWRRILTAVPVILMLAIPSLGIRIALAAWLFVQLVIDAREYDRKLRDAGFDPAFCDRLDRLAMLANVGTTSFVLGFILQST